jgi:hypothetical protein
MIGDVVTYLVVAEDGTSHEHHHRLTAANTASIDDIVRAAVGGWLEPIPVTDPTLAVWCDEDGRPRRRTVNPVGSRLAVLLGGRPAAYVGPIVITGKQSDRMVGLTEAQIAAPLAALDVCRQA